MARTNEENLDLFADLLEPMAAILSDTEVAAISKNGGSAAKLVKAAIKNQKQAVVELLAVIDGEDPENYVVPGPIAIGMKLLQIFNSPDMKDLFTGQGQTNAAEFSGSVTGNIGGEEN